MHWTLGRFREKCRFFPAKHIFRKEKNDYDLEELCTGISEEYPIDVYVQDGTLV